MGGKALPVASISRKRRPTSSSWRTSSTTILEALPAEDGQRLRELNLALNKGEDVVADDRYTSIHIEELSVVARDTKLGRRDYARYF